jgi:8-oxo-dGTP diphosphatase
MPYTPVLATLGYIFSPDGQSLLMIHRNARPGESHFGKYNGLGGKLEPGEDIVAGMKREIHEEANILCTDVRLAGTISWPGFGQNGEDWFGFLFRIFAFEGTPSASNSEGTLSWIPIDQVLSLPLWDGDRFFLPLIFDRQSPVFHGVMPYQSGHPISWKYST